MILSPEETETLDHERVHLTSYRQKALWLDVKPKCGDSRSSCGLCAKEEILCHHLTPPWMEVAPPLSTISFLLAYFILLGYGSVVGCLSALLHSEQ